MKSWKSVHTSYRLLHQLHRMTTLTYSWYNHFPQNLPLERNNYMIQLRALGLPKKQSKNNLDQTKMYCSTFKRVRSVLQSKHVSFSHPSPEVPTLWQSLSITALRVWQLMASAILKVPDSTTVPTNRGYRYANITIDQYRDIRRESRSSCLSTNHLTGPYSGYRWDHNYWALRT